MMNTYTESMMQYFFIVVDISPFSVGLKWCLMDMDGKEGQTEMLLKWQLTKLQLQITFTKKESSKIY